MQKLLYLTLYCIIMSGCASIQHKDIAETKLPVNVQFSSSFRMLWNELNKETQHFKQIHSFVPNELQIKKYHIQQQDHTYYVRGFIRSKKALNKEMTDKFKNSITIYSETLYGFRISISDLPEFVNMADSAYIELSTKANTRQ